MGISGRKQHVPGAEGQREESTEQLYYQAYIGGRKAYAVHLYKNVHPCCPSQPKVETTQMSIDRQMDKQNMIEPHSGTFNHENE